MMTTEQGLEAMRTAIAWMEQERKRAVLSTFVDYYDRMIDELREEADLLQRQLNKDAA